MKAKFLLPLALLPLLASCNYSIQPDDPVTITDMQGQEVTFDRNKINRVVCVGAGALRFYSYVCDINKIIGVEDIDGPNTFGVGQAIRPYYDANKDYLKTLPSIGLGGPNKDINLDTGKILLANPDIIISFYNLERNNKIRKDTGNSIPVVALQQGDNGIFDDITIKSFELLGNIFKRTDRVNQIKKYITDAKEDLATKASSKDEETYYAGCIGNWGATDLYGSFNNFPVFKFANVNNALDDLKTPFSGTTQVKVDEEKLTSIDPDKIFIDTAGINGFLTDYKKDHSVYDNLKAFQNKETYLLLPYNAYYTNLEIQLMSTYYVASIAHPNSFRNFNFEEKMNEILTTFVGKSIYSELKEHPYGFGGYQKVDIEDLIK